MSNIYDIFIRTQGDNLPVATLTIGLPDQKNYQEQEKEQMQISESNGAEDKVAALVAEGDNDMMVLDLKNMIYEKALPEFQLIPSRQSLFFKGQELSPDHKSLASFDITVGSVLHLADKGAQIPVLFAKSIIWFSVLFIWYTFKSRHLEIYSFFLGTDYMTEHFEQVVKYEEDQVQRAARFMINIHFLKLILELFFVHNTSGKTKSFNNLLQNFVFYCCGQFVVAFSFFHPGYEHSGFFPEYFILIIFAFAEITNAKCHLHFKQVEAEINDKYQEMYGKPKGPEGELRRTQILQSLAKCAPLNELGFALVTGADWFWESIAWLCIAFVIQTPLAFIWVAIFITWHGVKAQERHARYVPTERFAFVPNWV